MTQATDTLAAALRRLLNVYQAMGNPRGPAEIMAEEALAALTAPTHERAAPATEPERLLRELLAIVHRDGGQYQDAVGLAQATNDAMTEYYRLRAIEDASPSQPVAAEGVTDEAPKRMTMEEFERDDHGYSGDCA